MYNQARTFRSSLHLATYPSMTPCTQYFAVFRFISKCHGLFTRRLAGLAPDLLALITDALAFVWLGWPELAQLRRDLSDFLFVDAFDHDRRRCRRRQRNAGRLRVVHRMRITDAHDEVLTLLFGAIA